MKFDKKLTCVTFYIIILMLFNGVLVEGQISLLFQRTFSTKESIEASFARILKKFQEKPRLDQAQKLEQKNERKTSRTLKIYILHYLLVERIIFR